MNLTIDIGNTLVKYAVFNNHQLEFIDKSVDTDYLIIQKILKDYNIQKVIVSSVREHKNIDFPITPIYLSHETKIPIDIHYKSIDTLGSDRISNIVAASSLYPKRNILVIDAGSCVTIDLINQDSKYIGGRISPGIDMRYKSLSIFTKKLPRLSLFFDYPKLGDDTNSCIISGVQSGIIAELDQIIHEIQQQNDDLFVLITGGDCFFFEKELKSNIFADPNLVLKGLDIILSYNE